MPQLSAFVGHSFLESDQLVVSKILKMLDTIANLMPDFDWDHALAAEPKLLSQKVREKMQGRNLFIGICTAKEYAIDADQLQSTWWNKKLTSKRENFEPKASDWIIQEIGMAVGRDMQIVLLRESGLRDPGGLQGDLEYITFDRSNPERCFDKLAEMLRSLLSVAKPVADGGQTVSPSETIPAQSEDDFLIQFFTPSTSWTADEYVQRFRLSIWWKKEEFQKRIETEFDASPLSNSAENKAAFRACGISARAEHHKGEWLDALRQLALEFVDQPGPYIALGERFSAADDHVQSADNYARAAELSTTPAQKIKLLTLAAIQRIQAHANTEIGPLIEPIEELVCSNRTLEAEGMARLASIWKETGNDLMYIACAERCLELAPDRAQPRFDLAYQYGELTRDADALFHYRQYLKAKDDPDGWNNMGVSATNLKLPVTGISAYRKSDKGGNTLGTSNLAFAFLNAGFLEEATTICREGLKAPDPHANLIDATARCNRAWEEEEKKEAELVKKTIVRRNVLRAMGKSSIKAIEVSVPEKWQGPNCILTATVTSTSILLVGTYVPPAGLGGIFALGGKEEKNQTVTVTYTGQLVGHAFIGKVKTSNSGSALASLLGDDDGSECIGTIDPTMATMELLQKTTDLVKLTSVSAP